MTRRISAAAFRAAWMDRTLRRKTVAAQFGISEVTARKWADTMGLPHKPRLIDKAALAEIWAKGDALATMAARWGVTEGAIRNAAKAMGLPSRRAAR